MSSSGEAGGLKELAKASMSSTNFALGMPRAFLPSVIDSREMLATGVSGSDSFDMMDGEDSIFLLLPYCLSKSQNLHLKLFCPDDCDSDQLAIITMFSGCRCGSSCCSVVAYRLR